MKKVRFFLREKIRKSLGKLSIRLYIRCPSQRLIKIMQRLNYIQLSPEQMELIINSINMNKQCKLLVFGLGNDSVLWNDINYTGKTIFIEDNKLWFQKIMNNYKLSAHLVDYATKRSQWKSLLESPERLTMSLPEEIEKEKWDVILVDAPGGYDDSTTGRMKSIFLATKLIKKDGDIFVHDCERQVEKIYCDRFLKEENFKVEIEARNGHLRYYKITNI